MTNQPKYFALFILFSVLGTFLLFPSCNSNSNGAATPSTTTPSKSSNTGNASANLSIAYVNMDSLNTQYAYYQSAKKALETKDNQANTTLQKKSQSLQNDYVLFQQKAQKGELTANQIAEKERSLGKRQEALMQEEQRLRQELSVQTQEVMDTMAVRLNRASQFVADKHGYDFVFKHAEVGSMMIVVPTSVDITNEVIAILNAEETPE